MKRSDRKVGDPTNIGKRGKTASMRKGRYDAGFTPSELRMRNKLMKQFTKLEGPSGNSEAYKQGWDRIFGGTP